VRTPPSFIEVGSCKLNCWQGASTSISSISKSPVSHRGSIVRAAPKNEGEMPMKRQMAVPPTDSDEARLVGDQPSSFEVEQRNGAASTSGKGAHHGCLAAVFCNF